MNSHHTQLQMVIVRTKFDIFKSSTLGGVIALERTARQNRALYQECTTQIGAKPIL